MRASRIVDSRALANGWSTTRTSMPGTYPPRVGNRRRTTHPPRTTAVRTAGTGVAARPGRRPRRCAVTHLTHQKPRRPGRDEPGRAAVAGRQRTAGGVGGQQQRCWPRRPGSGAGTRWPRPRRSSGRAAGPARPAAPRASPARCTSPRCSRAPPAPCAAAAPASAARSSSRPAGAQPPAAGSIRGTGSNSHWVTGTRSGASAADLVRAGLPPRPARQRPATAPPRPRRPRPRRGRPAGPGRCGAATAASAATGSGGGSARARRAAARPPWPRPRASASAAGRGRSRQPPTACSSPLATVDRTSAASANPITFRDHPALRSPHLAIRAFAGKSISRAMPETPWAAIMIFARVVGTGAEAQPAARRRDHQECQQRHVDLALPPIHAPTVPESAPRVIIGQIHPDPNGWYASDIVTRGPGGALY